MKRLTIVLLTLIVSLSFFAGCVTMSEMRQRTNVSLEETAKIPYGAEKIKMQGNYSASELYTEIIESLYSNGFTIESAGKEPYFINTGNISDGNTYCILNIMVNDNEAIIYPKYLEPKVYSGGMSLGSGEFITAKWHDNSTIYSYAYLMGVSVAVDISNEKDISIFYQ